MALCFSLDQSTKSISWILSGVLKASAGAKQSHLGGTKSWKSGDEVKGFFNGFLRFYSGFPRVYGYFLGFVVVFWGFKVDIQGFLLDFKAQQEAREKGARRRNCKLKNDFESDSTEKPENSWMPCATSKWWYIRQKLSNTTTKFATKTITLTESRCNTSEVAQPPLENHPNFSLSFTLRTDPVKVQRLALEFFN